jgi:hypothetical protein
VANEYEFGSELPTKLVDFPLTTEDGLIISGDIIHRIQPLAVQKRGLSQRLFPMISIKRQKRILKYGSHRAKVAMKRARRHDGDKPTRESLAMMGEILRWDFKRELCMLRAGFPQAKRHPELKVHSDVHFAARVGSDGVKRDLRDVDYMHLLTSLTNIEEKQ